MRTQTLMRTLVIAIALQQCGCAGMMGALGANNSYREHRRYMADRAAAEVVETEERTLDEVLATARNLHKHNKSDQAMRLYLDAFRLDPDDMRAHLGVAYLQLVKQPKRSETVLLTVIEKQPDSAMAHLGLGLARFAQGNPDAAIAPLERAIELNPQSARAHNALSVVLGRTDRLLEALAHAQIAHDLAPEDAQFANNLGVSHLRVGNASAAEVSFRAAVELEPADPAFANNLGATLGQMGRYEEAYRAFRTAGDEQVARNNVGQMYHLGGNLDEAIVHYELALLAGGDQASTVLRNLNSALDARDRQKSN